MISGNKTPPNNTAVWTRGTYRTGDGEVIVAPRPGAQAHENVPSMIGNQRCYRDGRKEAGND